MAADLHRHSTSDDDSGCVADEYTWSPSTRRPDTVCILARKDPIGIFMSTERTRTVCILARKYLKLDFSGLVGYDLRSINPDTVSSKNEKVCYGCSSSSAPDAILFRMFVNA